MLRIYYGNVVVWELLISFTCFCFCFFVGLGISYTIDLDRVKTVSRTDSFRRMFFIDEETKEKVFVINDVYNLTKRGESHCTPPRTVYLKVRLIQRICI